MGDSNLITVEQFEIELRKSAQAAYIAETKAKEAWKTALIKTDVLDVNEPTANVTAGIRLPKSGTKYITGASVYFEGWANNNNGYWMWEYLNVTKVYMDYNNPSHRFSMTSYTHTFIDARRTCAVNYIGTMYDLVLWTFWVPRDCTQYLEWYASM